MVNPTFATPEPHTSDLSKYIETRLFGNRPHIKGRRIPVAIIAYQARANHWTVAETAYNFSLPEEQILAALLYYTEHREAIDAQEAHEEALFDEKYEQHDRS